jgi:beta propeller repeat protein
MKSRYFFLLLTFIFLILTSAISSAGKEIRLTSDEERGFHPAIYNDKVIWLSEEYEGTIFMRDLFTGKEIQITNQSVSEPAIYGDRIVWIDQSIEGKNDIYVYNLSTKEETRVTIGRGTVDPEIYGDRIVWKDSRNGSTNIIHVYDLTTKKETQITTKALSFDLAIYGDTIVFTGAASLNGKNGIYMYNISTRTETQVSADYGISPAIYEDRIVYKRNNDIYLYNRSTFTETPITTNGSVKDKVLIMSNCMKTPINNSGPAENRSFNESTCLVTQITNSGSLKDTLNIHGDRIVWADWRNGNYDIYMYDLSMHKETQITADKSDQLNPVIYSDRLVWESYCSPIEKNYSCGIFIYNLPDKPIIPFSSFSTNVTSGYGNVPLTVLFTDTSEGGEPSSWYWDFGDEINSKHAQTATHTFIKSGTYDVSLTVTNSAGSSTQKKLNCITVTPPQAPIADFFSPELKYDEESIPVNETLLFLDNSTGSPTSWFWNFGDGTTSTTQNPTHAYNENGGYTVTLTVENEMGSNTTSKHGYVIIDSEGDAIHPANFSSNVTSGTAPLIVLFHDTTAGNITQDYAYGRDWYFGDGTDSYMDIVQGENNNLDKNNSSYLYIVHTYKKPGKYTVKLHSYDFGGQSVITKYNYINVTAPENKG